MRFFKSCSNNTIRLGSEHIVENKYAEMTNISIPPWNLRRDRSTVPFSITYRLIPSSSLVTLATFSNSYRKGSRTVSLIQIRSATFGMPSKSIALCFVLFYLSLVAGARPKKRVPPKPKPINWNLSFYSEPFKLCKTLRKFNPVEEARAHGEAVATFRQCGPKLIIHYATRYNFPAFGKNRWISISCWLMSEIAKLHAKCIEIHM